MVLLVQKSIADVSARPRYVVNKIYPDGRYNYAFETTNSIRLSEMGFGGSHVSGSYSYRSPEGEDIKLKYTADENGYHPIGDHLPTPPPIPDYIQKSIAYIKAHPFPVIYRIK